jgi:hypothetical protein
LARWIALKASLFGQDPLTVDSNSRASSAWYALVQVEDVEGISWFLRTALDLSSLRGETFPRFEESPFGGSLMTTISIGMGMGMEFGYHDF